MKHKPLIVVVGPTASGKSDFAMQLAQRYNGELICADSRTLYKGMNIGTAKPSLQDQALIPHHMLDVLEPGQPFSAADFKVRATHTIEEILAKGKLPILVGGTGLYIDAVIFNLSFGPPADLDRRDQLNALTVVELQNYCKSHNIALPVNDKNKRHLVRAIELGGLKQEAKQLRTDTLVVGLSTEKHILRERIKKRVQIMLEQGIVDEVAQLGERYGWGNEAMKGNIYRIFKGVVDGSKPLQDALQESVYSDIHLAKRQMTWFRRNKHIQWGTMHDLQPVVQNFLSDVGYIGKDTSLLQ